MRKRLQTACLLLLTAIIHVSAQGLTYAASSVLAKGNWAKIAVEETGICQVTPDVLRSAGITDVKKARVFGYGGNMVPESLTQYYLREHDDLKEVPVCIVDGKLYFMAYGPVAWPATGADAEYENRRQRNPYSDYGYYFITQGDRDSTMTLTQEELLARWYADPTSHHSLYEDDSFVWSQMGRLLFDRYEVEAGSSRTYSITIPGGNTSARISVAVASGGNAVASVMIGNRNMGAFTISAVDYDVANVYLNNYSVSAIDTLGTKDGNGNIVIPVTIRCTSGNVRLDYIAAGFDNGVEYTQVADACRQKAIFAGRVANQNHHADEPTDLIIIVPSSGKLIGQAQELARLHAEHDGMSVRIVPASELYNEFSSGTPDASAYRRYMKMFYDRAEADGTKMPRNLLLFGDAVWDQRRCFVTDASAPFHDYLLCYEAEDTTSRSSGIVNNVNKKYSMASDDFFAVLQDGKTLTGQTPWSDTSLRFDVGVGRIPVSNAADAKVVVDKIKHYVNTGYAGSWQNEIMFVGDDGDANSHMRNLNRNADYVIDMHPGYDIKKLMADAYERESTSQGFRYSNVSQLMFKQQNDGALMINYAGHGNAVQLSHELILSLTDIDTFKGENYPLWFTAACETMPYDIPGGSVGENLLLRNGGGCIAFMGTSRTVLEDRNAVMNNAFTHYVLSYDSLGNALTLGEAQRRAKNDITRGSTFAGMDATLNKHHYNLLGDPAMALALPRYTAVVDTINGEPTSDVVTVKGNGVVKVAGHIQNAKGERTESFNGMATIVIRDSKGSVECHNNDGSADNPFVYSDRLTTLYKGTCEVKGGDFSFVFRMPSEINGDGETALVTVYAVSDDSRSAANGECRQICALDWEDASNDGVGPSIYAYLNNKEFQNGSTVGGTPFFVAEVSDKDGIDATSATFGHNMQLIVDGRADMTFNLDDNFQFDAGSYTDGQTYYVLPELSAGQHKLTFRAWDLLGNPNTVDLTFVVNSMAAPRMYDIAVYPNPVHDEATFWIYTDMQGSDADIAVDIIDMSGRVMRTMRWNEVLAIGGGATKLKWSAAGLSPGMYVYRARITCDGRSYSTKSSKLIKAE